MTENITTEFTATGRTTSLMFELLEASSEDVVAIRVGCGTPTGYLELYELLVEKTDAYGTVHMYEETTDWTLATYLSHVHGIVPDLRLGPHFDIDRYAAVGNSRWTKLLYDQWRLIAPVWPVAPNKMRYFDQSDRYRALGWVTDGAQQS